MDIVNVLWQVGIISAVIVFGVKIGLAAGLANLSKKYLAAICIGYGAGVLILSRIASYYSSQLVDMIYSYNSVFFILMAIIMVLAGILTIREWKVHHHNTSTATALVVVAPCPCCFGVIIATILLVAPTVSFGVFEISQYVSVALVFTIIASYFASNYLVRLTNKPYPVILGNFELFLGIYFLVSAIVLPNIASNLSKTFQDLSIASVDYVAMIIVFIVFLIFIGLIFNRGDGLLN